VGLSALCLRRAEQTEGASEQAPEDAAPRPRSGEGAGKGIEQGRVHGGTPDGAWARSDVTDRRGCEAATSRGGRVAQPGADSGDRTATSLHSMLPAAIPASVKIAYFSPRESGQRMAGLGRVVRSAAPTGHPPRGGCDGGMAEASSARNAITRQEERGFGVPAHVPAIHSRSGACRRFPDTPDP
jgi:hypothetical protein